MREVWVAHNRKLLMVTREFFSEAATAESLVQALLDAVRLLPSRGTRSVWVDTSPCTVARLETVAAGGKVVPRSLCSAASMKQPCARSTWMADGRSRSLHHCERRRARIELERCTCPARRPSVKRQAMLTRRISAEAELIGNRQCSDTKVAFPASTECANLRCG